MTLFTMPRQTFYPRSNLDNAVRDVRRGASFSFAASNWSVPKNTLRTRLQNHNRDNELQQCLTYVQEVQLVN